MTSFAGRPLVFFGSPEAAVVVLSALVDAGRAPLGVVTRPERRRSRGSRVSATPVGVWASEHGLPVVHSIGEAAGWLADGAVGVVVAYGRIIPAAILHTTTMLNVHFSLLPRWRGAAPVERAILAGDTITGVSIMQLEAALDTGPVFARIETPIDPSERAPELTMRLAGLGADLLLQVLDDPRPVAEPQTGDPNYADKIDNAETEIDWSQSSHEIERVVRALPAHSEIRGARLRVISCAVIDRPPPEGSPGTLLADGSVITGDGMLQLRVVQPEGRRPLEVAAWLAGFRSRDGERFSSLR